MKFGDDLFVIWACSLEGIKLIKYTYNPKMGGYVHKKEKKLGTVHSVGKEFEIEMLGNDPKTQRILITNSKNNLICLIDPIKVIVKPNTTKFSIMRLKEKNYDFSIISNFFKNLESSNCLKKGDQIPGILRSLVYAAVRENYHSDNYFLKFERNFS